MNRDRVQPAFAVAVLQALRDIDRDMKTVDPYFDEIRNAREQPPTAED